MARWGISDYSSESGSGVPDLQAPFTQVARSMPSSDTLGGDIDPISPSWRRFPKEPAPDILRRCQTRRNLTDASLSQIRRGLAHAWRLTLALQLNDARGVIDHIELQLDDLSPAIASRFRTATQLLRAAALALQDDSLGALAVAISHVGESATSRNNYVASTLCRLGFWQLGEFDAFDSLPRHQPRVRWSKSRALSAMFDLSIEAAAALDRLRLSTAKRLASDALTIAEAANAAGGLTALPACITAQVLYEEGRLDEAGLILRDRLPEINAEGSIECALRAYLVLTRIARQKAQFDLAAILLHEGVTLGERRGWARLVVACVAERASLLLETGRTREARLSVEYLDRYAATHQAGSGHSCSEIARYRALIRCRVSWAEAPSREAVAAFRQLYHHAIERSDLHVGCRLAVELAEMLETIGESREADALLSRTIKAAAAAGLCQVFLERRAGLAQLLRRAYEHADEPASTDRALRPFIGSLVSQRETTGTKDGIVPFRSTGDTLTGRECEILSMIGHGLANKGIARNLRISPETVKSHVKRIFLKLAVSTRAEAVSRANCLGLL